MLLICKFWFEIPFEGDTRNFLFYIELRRAGAFNLGNLSNNATDHGLLFRVVNANGFAVGNGYAR